MFSYKMEFHLKESLTMRNTSHIFPRGSSFQDNLYFSFLISHFSFGDLIASLMSSLIVNYIITRWLEKKLKNQHLYLSFLLIFLFTHFLDKLISTFISILLPFICHSAWRLMARCLTKTAQFVSHNLDRFMFSPFPSFLKDTELYLFLSHLNLISFFLLFVIVFTSNLSSSEMETVITDATDTVDTNIVEFIMERLGITKPATGEGGRTKDCICMGCEEFSALFGEEEPSLDEVKEAFSVFDQNRDSFIDARELQRVLITLGITEGTDLDACALMIEQYDGNGDAKIDSIDFCKLLVLSLC